jgi:hypothetical protein
MFYKLNFDEKFNYEYIYPTTHDAILHICHRTNATANTAVKSSPIYQKRFSQRHSRAISQLIAEENDTKQQTCGQDPDDHEKFLETTPPDEIEFIDEIQANKA